MIDKRDTQQILGCLMKKPQLLSEIDKYSFVLTDFSTRFERSIFMAISGLYRNGATKIQPIDIENFIDLWIAQLYSGDYDTRNVRYFNNTKLDGGKVKMIGYDFDFAFEHYPDNYFVWMLDSSGMGYYKINNKLMLNLMKNKKFKNKFLERLGYNLNNIWTYEHMMEFYNKYYNLVKTEVKRDHERWNFSYSSWEEKCKQIKTFIENRNDLIKSQAKSYFDISYKDMKKYFEKK